MANFMQVDYLPSFLESNMIFNTNKYLVSGTFYDFVTNTLQAVPFFWVWISSIIVWFFLELSIWLSHYFNSKHSYLNNLKRSSLLTFSSINLLRRSAKAISYLNIITVYLI